ncbi:MAG: hypothetical protein QGG64_06075 [Candidatus Latescibacteria bacterium]|nr:hypothetical protein [Candidatus Latescibacterota bacterium]
MIKLDGCYSVRGLGIVAKYWICLCGLLLFACGGGGSSTGPTPPPTPDPDPPPNGSTTPTVRNRSFTIERLAVDSGPELFVVQPPQVTGALTMQASGRYSMGFRVAVGGFVWEQTVVGTHTFVGNTLRMTPDDSLKNAPEPFLQTVIVENTDVAWTGETRVVINMPIRPGGFRAEDRIELSYVQGTQVASGLTRPIDNQMLSVLNRLASRE